MRMRQLSSSYSIPVRTFSSRDDDDDVGGDDDDTPLFTISVITLSSGIVSIVLSITGRLRWMLVLLTMKEDSEKPTENGDGAEDDDNDDDDMDVEGMLAIPRGTFLGRK